MKNWFLAAVFAALILSLPSAKAAPPPWLAAVGDTGGMAGGPAFVLYSVPSLIVYADGTAVWPEARKLNQTERIDPETWRTGMVSREALKQFRAMALANNFFAIEPHPVAALPGAPMMVNDASTAHVAVQFGGKKRVIEEYALGIGGFAGRDETYLKTIIATRDAILALKPAQSTAFKPTSIRVGVFSVYSPFDSIAWPLNDTLTLSERNHWLVYTGHEAQMVIQALARSAYITSGGHVYQVVWVPNIDIPANPPAK